MAQLRRGYRPAETRSLMNSMRTRLGMLTPSSNSVLEPVTCAMLAGAPGITAHFSRFRVTEIGLDTHALDQFDSSRMLPAADLLADAKVDAMAWNGTSASWLGIERDRSLCEAISSRTGKPATTSTLACIDAVRSIGAQRVGFVTPYTDDVQLRIGKVWAGEGLPVMPSDISACAIISRSERCCRDRGHDPCCCCRGLRRDRNPLHEHGRGGHNRCPGARTERLDFDSVAVTLWRTMLLAGADPRILSGWDGCFSPHFPRSDRRHFTCHSSTWPSAAVPS